MIAPAIRGVTENIKSKEAKTCIQTKIGSLIRLKPLALNVREVVMKFTPPISIEANSSARASRKRTVPKLAPKNLSGSALKGG
jgi:hypothetical protein